jgi:hypothetical protein
MNPTRDAVIALAKSQIGYTEEPKGSNKNKYAAEIDRKYPNFYNGPKGPGVNCAWCDIFVDWCFLTVAQDEKDAEYALCQPPKSAGAGCSFSYSYYKKAGRASNIPEVGAQIFFKNTSGKIHTGIVINVTDDKIVTVEGNSGDCVKKHTYSKSNSKIYGYGLPRYAEASEDPKPEPTKDTYKVCTNGSPLRLRNKPTTKSFTLINIPNGVTIKADEIVKGEKQHGSDEWIKTTYKGCTGYCAAGWCAKA